MIRLENVVRRHLLRYRLHGSKVIAHPRKTGKRRGVAVAGRFEFCRLQFLPVHDAFAANDSYRREVIELSLPGNAALRNW